MPSGKQVVVRVSDTDDSALEESLDSVAAAEMVKKLIDSHKKRRYGIRQGIEADYRKKVAEIRKRYQKRMADYTAKIGKTHRDKIDRLINAIDARDAKQRAIAEKLARVHVECSNLAAQLEAVYEARAEKALAASVEGPAPKTDKGKGRAL